jgi:tetratricopeptide (TPR) repeat protein
MTSSEADLHQMLAEVYRLDGGPARWAGMDAVFRHADAADNLAFAFRARLNALHDFHHSGEYARALLAFSWCLSTFDRHPEVTQPSDGHALLWRYKWIIWEISQFSGVSLPRAGELLDDMQRRYQEGGHSLHAVYQHRGLLAHHTGDFDAARHWFAEMTTARRDNLSDCAWCVPSTYVSYLRAASRDAEAIEIGTPYTTGGCTEQPQWMLSELLLPYVRTGRAALAIKGHRRAYEQLHTSRHTLELVGLNLEFCGLTGNEQHALTIVERHLPWRDRPASPYAAMEFASGAALVLRRLVETGRGNVVLRRRSDDATRRWDSTVAQTHDELAALAWRMAAEFDARNGNHYQSQRTEARLAAAPLLAELPMTVLTGRPIEPSEHKPTIDAVVGRVADLTAAGDRQGAARAQLDVAYALRNAAEWADATEAAEEAQRSLDAAGLVDEALAARYLLVELYGRSRKRTVVLALVDELLAAPWRPDSVPPPAVLLEETAYLAGRGAGERLLRAAELYRSVSDHSGEARCLRRSLSWLSAHSPEAVLARLDELIADHHVDDSALPDLYDAMAAAQARAGDLSGALERTARSPRPSHLLRARLLLRLGRPAEAEEHGRQAMADGRDNETTWQAAVVVARSQIAQGRMAEAEAFMAEHELDEDEVTESAGEDEF